jgi:predicted lipoprotein
MRVCLAALAVALFAGTAGAADVAPRDLVASVVRDFAQPRSSALAGAAQAQVKAWEDLCAAPTAPEVDAARAAFQAAADAWNNVALLRLGPVSVDFRAERLYFWPDRKNTTGRAVAALIGANAPPTAATVLSGSAAAQGLPALERILFEEGAATLATPAGAARCAAGRAVAGAFAVLADDVARGWSAAGGEGDRMMAAIDVEAQELASRIATDLVTAYAMAADVRLSPVLGASAAEAKPTHAELWRAGRAARALRRELDSAATVIALIGGRESKIAAEARAIAGAALPDDLGKAAADPKARKALVDLRDRIKAFQTRLADALPDVIGTGLGFNALDGD